MANVHSTLKTKSPYFKEYLSFVHLLILPLTKLFLRLGHHITFLFPSVTLIACLSSFFFPNECGGQRLTAAICFNCSPLNTEFSTLPVWLSSKPISSITEITDTPCTVSIYMGAEDPDSAPHAWAASVLLTEPSV